MTAIAQVSDETPWPVDVRWREVRQGRGRRLAQPVRLSLLPASLAELVAAVTPRAHLGEFKVTTRSGQEWFVHAAELRRWAHDPAGLPREMPDPHWRADTEQMVGVAAATEAFRLALGRLTGVGALRPEVAQGFLERLHVALASLPVSALPLWRP